VSEARDHEDAARTIEESMPAEERHGIRQHLGSGG
jgi:hypothetical protein